MPLFVTLAVEEVSKSADWYRSVLGFSVVFMMPDQSGTIAMAHLRLQRYADLLLVASRSPVPIPRGGGVQINFTLSDRTVDDLAAHVKDRWQNCEGPLTRPWNAREFYVTDPDGYRLAFVQQAMSGLGFDEVIARVKDA